MGIMKDSNELVCGQSLRLTTSLHLPLPRTWKVRFTSDPETAILNRFLWFEMYVLLVESAEYEGFHVDRNLWEICS